VVWPCLDAICKIYEDLKKKEKRKRFQKKGKRAPGAPFRPSRERSLRPNLPPPEPVPCLSHPVTDMWAPHVSSVFSPEFSLLSLELVTAGELLTPAPSPHAVTAIKMLPINPPRAPLSSLSFSPLIRLKRIYNFWCSMLVFTPFAYCFVTLSGTFMHFPELTY
jgi:hypothetical protein